MYDDVTRARLLCCLLAVLLPAGIVLLFTVPPSASTFYPRCMFFSWTGLHCPGCGTTRCYHALLHLQFSQAIAYNVPGLLILPLYVIEGGRLAYHAIRGRPAPRVVYPKWLMYAFLGFLLIYWILRNIPYYPFVLLAPHAV